MARTVISAKRYFRMPLLQGILPIDRSRLSAEIVAGITLAALGIPEVMGYTRIAGMPVITGLYTLLLPLAAFAVLGSSRHLVVGADSATAAIMAAGLARLASMASPQYVSLAGITAILVAGFLLLSRLIRLGFLADFLSRSVLIGFLTGVGVQVAMGQLAGMLGVPGGTGGTLSKFFGTLEQTPQTSVATLAVSLSVLALIVGMRRLAPRVPGALIAVVGAIVVSWAADLQAHGVAVIGPVPGGLPSLGVPNYGWNEWKDLLGMAASIFLVILAQSAATSRAYAARYNEPFNEDVDLVGLSVANLAAGFSGTFVVNGSPTKTQMVDSAGGRSQIAAMITAVIVVVVLLFLTKPLQYMPEAVLSSVVFLIGIELIDLRGMRRIRHWRVDEFVVASITALFVVLLGVEQGIILAIVLSMIGHLRRGYHPRNSVIERTHGERFHEVPLTDEGAVPEMLPGLIAYRFTASLYYANAHRFTKEIRHIVKGQEHPPRWLCIEGGAVADIDFSAGEALLGLHDELKGGGTRIVFTEVSADVRAELDRYGVTELVGADSFFDSLMDVVAAYERTLGEDAPAGGGS